MYQQIGNDSVNYVFVNTSIKQLICLNGSGFQVTKEINQRTICPVSLTWVLRICWFRTNLDKQTLGPTFCCQQESLITLLIYCKFQKKSLWGLFLYNFFMILYMHIAPGQEQTTSRGQSFNVNRNVSFIHLLQVSKQKFSKSDFIHFLMI